MNSDEPQETEIVYRNTQSVQDCDYFDGQTCYRYRNGSSRYSYGSREVVRYREPRTYVVAERNSYRNTSYAEPRRTYEVASRSSFCSCRRNRRQRALQNNYPRNPRAGRSRL